MNKKFDLVGNKFDRLTVISFHHTGVNKSGRGQKQRWWLCRCECGKEVLHPTGRLRARSVKSCGCYRSDFARIKFTTHGKSKTREYVTWHSMIQRCYYCKRDSYNDYGGRDITVCKRWLTSFDNFYADMCKKPTPKHTIERIDPNGNYTPENTIWLEAHLQQENTRRSVSITWQGETHGFKFWADKFGVDVRTIRKRYYKSNLRPPELFSPTRRSGNNTGGVPRKRSKSTGGFSRDDWNDAPHAVVVEGEK